GQRGVDLDDRPRHRGIDVGSGLDRLDHRAGGARLDAVADGGQVDIDQIAEQALGMVGNTDGDLAVTFYSGPLVGLHELEIARDFAHRIAPETALLGVEGSV